MSNQLTDENESTWSKMKKKLSSYKPTAIKTAQYLWVPFVVIVGVTSLVKGPSIFDNNNKKPSTN